MTELLDTRLHVMLERKHLLTTSDLAELTQNSQETVRYWRARGEGPRWFKLGRTVRYLAEDVESWLNEARSGHGAV